MVLVQALGHTFAEPGTKAFPEFSHKIRSGSQEEKEAREMTTFFMVRLEEPAKLAVLHSNPHKKAMRDNKVWIQKQKEAGSFGHI